MHGVGIAARISAFKLHTAAHLPAQGVLDARLRADAAATCYPRPTVVAIFHGMPTAPNTVEEFECLLAGAQRGSAN